MRGADVPLSRREADVGFICSPSFFWLRGGNNAKAVLALADRSSPVEISRAVRIPEAGDHVFEVKADGP